NRLRYDTAEVQQMLAYFDGPGTLPSTLRWASGGQLCTLDLQITNTGKEPVIIQTQQLRLLHTPRKNTTLYRLVDECSFHPGFIGACPGLAGGPEEVVGFSLGNASTPVGTVFIPALHTEDEGGSPSMKPGSAPLAI